MRFQSTDDQYSIPVICNSEIRVYSPRVFSCDEATRDARVSAGSVTMGVPVQSMSRPFRNQVDSKREGSVKKCGVLSTDPIFF